MKPMIIFQKAALALPFLAAALAIYPAAEPLAADANAGAQIVAQGTKSGGVACARCHGFDGMADGSGAFPKLAGQSAIRGARPLNYNQFKIPLMANLVTRAVRDAA